MPAVLLMAFLMGVAPHWAIKNRKIRRTVGVAKLVIPVILGFLSADLVRRESWHGILQFCDNRAVTQGETVYTLFIAIFVMITIYVVLTAAPELAMLFGNDVALERARKKKR